jgi:hypothetical protein
MEGYNPLTKHSLKMSRKASKKRAEAFKKIRKSQPNEVNLIPFSPDISNPSFLGFKLKNVNQLWDWRTLEDVKL